jgi:sulfur carrier protein ThiS
MIVNVKSLADMKKYTAHLAEGGNMEIPEGTTVGEVLKKLKVPTKPRKLAIVNGRHRSFDHILQQGDHLVFFPPLEGG